jgi:hypothetical protein
MGAFFGFSIFRFLFGGSPTPKQKQQSKQNQTKQTKKIIRRDEGEYVDFEEIN